MRTCFVLLHKTLSMAPYRAQQGILTNCWNKSRTTTTGNLSFSMEPAADPPNSVFTALTTISLTLSSSTSLIDANKKWACIFRSNLVYIKWERAFSPCAVNNQHLNSSLIVGVGSTNEIFKAAIYISVSFSDRQEVFCVSATRAMLCSIHFRTKKWEVCWDPTPADRSISLTHSHSSDEHRFTAG